MVLAQIAKKRACVGRRAVTCRPRINLWGYIMKLAKVLASVAVATSLVAAPLVAQAAAAGLRSGAEVEGENLRGGFIIPLIAIIAIILGILAATSGGGDAPTSP